MLAAFALSLRCVLGVHRWMVIAHSVALTPTERMCTRCGCTQRIGGAS